MASSNYICGIHAVEAMLKYQPENIRILYMSPHRELKRLKNICELAEEQGIRIESAPPKRLSQWAGEARHQGVVAKIKHSEDKPTTLEALLQHLEGKQNPLILALDGLQDPHNLGACLRSAEALGVDGVILPRNRSVAVTPTVQKVACGAAELLPIVTVSNLAQALGTCQSAGLWVMGTACDPSAIPLQEADMLGPTVLLMGCEATGIKPLLASRCDGLVTIPMPGKSSSLNVSVATGIALYEIARQRSKKKS